MGDFEATFGSPLVAALDRAFIPCPSDPACPYCQGAAAAPDWSFVDAAYCISLRERPDRFAQAAAELHRVGLCRLVRFYRPTKPPDLNTRYAIWESHRLVACHAQRQDARAVLILEDDVRFTVRSPATLRDRAANGLRRLPRGWWCLLLGHWPLSGWFAAPGILKSYSGCLHAYVAARPLIEWLAEMEPLDPRVDYRSPFGKGLDSAIANLGRMYALFPMVAVQRRSGSDHIPSARVKYSGEPRTLLDKFRYRDLVMHWGMRPAEMVCAVLSPLHRTIARKKKIARSDEWVRVAEGRDPPPHIAVLRPDLVQRVLAATPVHLKAQYAIAAATGVRIATMLFALRLSDVKLTPLRERIVFRGLSAGADVDVSLPPPASAVLRDYIGWRGGDLESDEPFLLTAERLPYPDFGRSAAEQDEPAFHAAREQAAAEVAAEADAKAAALLEAGSEREAVEARARGAADALLLRRLDYCWFRRLARSHFAERIEPHRTSVASTAAPH